MPSDLKPVAWMYSHPGARPTVQMERIHYATTWTETPLYTHPPVAPEAQGLVERIRAFADGDHERGCEGRCYACTCGYDEDVALTLEQAAALITAQASQLDEAREALEEVAACMLSTNGADVGWNVGRLTKARPLIRDTLARIIS